MNMPKPLHRPALLAGMLALASAPAMAGESLSALAYAGGEALAPEQEARMVALITTPGGALTRDEVREQLADAQRGGMLAEAGEIAETPRVLIAREASNERQVQAILAAREAQRARLAAAEAEAAAAAEARRQAQVLAQAAPAAQAEAHAETAADDAATVVMPAAWADADVAVTAAPAEPADEPADQPLERPLDRPALAPLEVPITRPSDLQSETLVDQD